MLLILKKSLQVSNVVGSLHEGPLTPPLAGAHAFCNLPHWSVVRICDLLPVKRTQPSDGCAYVSV